MSKPSSLCMSGKAIHRAYITQVGPGTFFKLHPKVRKSHWKGYLKTSKRLANRACSLPPTTNRTHQTCTSTRRTTNHNRLGSLHRTHRIPLARALTRCARAQTAATMATVMAIKQGRSKGISESVSGWRPRIVETVSEARDVGEHRRGSTASATHRTRSTVVVRMKHWKREACKRIGGGDMLVPGRGPSGVVGTDMCCCDCWRMSSSYC
jgi:hypothetical protein